MIERTRVSGWDTRAEPAVPIEVFLEGHVAPETAIDLASERGLDSDAYVTVQHQIIDLPKWVKPKWDCPKRVN